MVAVAITAIIGALTVGSFRQVDRAAEIVRAQGDRYSAARVALTRLTHELTEAFLSITTTGTSTGSVRRRSAAARTSCCSRRWRTSGCTSTRRSRIRRSSSTCSTPIRITPARRRCSAAEAAHRRRSGARRAPRARGRPDHAFRLGYWDPKRKEGARVVDARDRARERAARARADRARDDAPRRSHREALDGGADRDHATARLLMRSERGGPGPGRRAERRSSS